MANIIESLTKSISPITKLIDEVVTTKEERLTLLNEAKKLENELIAKGLDYEKERLKQQLSVIVAESQGRSWLQRNWRPITMLSFLVLVVLDSLGLLPFRLADDAWRLLQIGIGGYVAGRTVEKIVPYIKNKK